MAPRKKTNVSQQQTMENIGSKHLTDKYFDVYEPKITMKVVQDLKNTTFTNFNNSSEHIPAWSSGLARAFVPLTFHFPELVIMCAQNYDSTSRVIRDKNQKAVFSISEKSLAEMLALSQNGDKIDEDALALEFSSLSISERLVSMTDWVITLDGVESNLPLSSLLFKYSVKEVITMICLVLGYNNDTLVDASILGFLLKFSKGTSLIL
jgi:hypothetical protein